VSPTISASGVGIRFQFDRQSRPVTPALARIRRHCSAAWGLRGVDLEAGPGDGIALVGPNGAGKTTLLRVIADVYKPDEGGLVVAGRVGSLLSIEGGLMAPLTGRENALLLGILGGLPRRHAKASLERVKQLSGLGRAYDRPVSSYSQGMRARLGFAVVENTQPNVLLLDEVHEALDHEFRDHVEHTARELCRAGGVLVAAGHDHGVLERLCGRALLLEEGRVVTEGPYQEVVSAYLGNEADMARAR
jgi:homopolymeric O-antigen transport system ATP-binding protein